MPKLIIRNDQSGATGQEVITFADGLTATEALMLNIPDGINPETTKIYVRTKEVRIGESPSDELFAPLFNNDTIVVINEVKGYETLAYIAIAALIVSVALAPNVPSPKIPGNVGQRKDSPNNSLQAQTNIARPYQAYPLVFGSPRIYPDLTGEATVEYVDNKKIVTQLMNVGVGLFDITLVRAGDTPLTNFIGSSSTVYEPVNKIVTIPEIVHSFASNEVDGQELLGTNEGDAGDSFNLAESGIGNTTFIGVTFSMEVLKDAQSDAMKAAFDLSGFYNVSIDYERNIVVNFVDVFVTALGSGRVISMDLDITLTFYTIIINGFTGQVADEPVGNPGDPQYQGPYLATEKNGAIIGPIKGSILTSEFWIDIIFSRGLKATAEFELTTQELDGPAGTPIGVAVVDTFLFTESTLDQQFFTYKKILASESFYQFTIRRTDNSSQNAEFPDQATLEAVRSVSRQTNVNLGNNTLVEIAIPATINATSLRQNRINLAATSKLITYDGANVVTTPAASRKMADALLHLYVDFYGLDSETLALDELYEIQNRLDLIDPRLATFDFTFDDIDVSLDERMDAILNVARCYKWLDGDVYRFARDEERENEATLITRRDIASEDERDYSLNFNPQLQEAFDSVKVEYVDKATNKKAYIFRSIDPASADPQSPTVLDTVGRNPKTMELAGCNEEFNAINRAELEIRKLIYQRFILTDTMLTSGMLLSKGDMVLYAEQYTSDLFDGEIMAINGSIATTSESIDFSVGALVLHYMLDDGTKVGPFSITEVVGDPFKFSSVDLAQAFLRDSELGFNIQTGSRYIIGQTVDLDAAKWTVVEKEARGSLVNISLITYDDRVYDFD